MNVACYGGGGSREGGQEVLRYVYWEYSSAGDTAGVWSRQGRQ